jgi:nitrogenase molybdenum-iron protein alpha/beta subunit
MESLRTCKLFGVIRAVLGIKGTLPIIHGPIGCFYHIKYLLSLRSGRPVTILSTEMDQNDVVFGAQEKLKQRIIKADKIYSPQLITVLSSCASSIIGENLDNVIENVKNDINADIISIDSGGFEGTQIEGYKECLMVLIGLMDETGLNEPQFMPKLLGEDIQKVESVNLVGLYRGGPDLRIIKNYFNRLDIDLNCVLTAGCTLKEVKTAKNADLNISMCDASGIEPCEVMEKKFGIPFLQETIPLGIRATSNYFSKVCNVFDRDYVFKDDEETAKDKINKYIPYLKDKRALIVAGATRAIALTGFISELGMKPVLVCLDFEANDTMEKLNILKKSYRVDPIVLKQPENLDIINEAKKLKLDIILGGMGELGLGKELAIPLIDIMHGQEITFGFEGAVALVKSIKETLTTNEV